MNTNPLRILALAAAIASSGIAAIEAQQTSRKVSSEQTSLGLEQIQATGRATPAGYTHSRVGDSTIGYAPGQPETVYPSHGYHDGAHSGPVYDGHDTPTLHPYWAQTPPHSYSNQVDDSMYFDPYQPDEYGVAPGAPLAEYCDAIYPHGHCYGYTRAEAFVLSRTIKADLVFTRQGVAGAPALSLNDLELEFEPGIRAVAGIPLSRCVTLEASYFGLHDWTDDASALDPNGNLFSVYSDFGLDPGFNVGGVPVFNFFDASVGQRIEFDSQLHNTELNLMYRIPVRSRKQEAWLLAGSRYLNLQERLVYTTQSQIAGLSSRSLVETDNDMVGGQLGGILHHFVTKKVRVSLDGKVGMLINYHEQHTRITTSQFPLGDELVRDHGLSMVTEAGAALTFDINCWCSVTGGYRMMYVDGAALAGKNFNTELPFGGRREALLNDDGSVLFHGAHLGGEVRW